MNQPMNPELLPPLHGVEAPPMSVSFTAVTARAEQIRRTSRRRRTATALVAAAAVAAVAVGATQIGGKTGAAPRPAHSTTPGYGPLFRGPGSVVGHNGEVARDLGGTYTIDRQSTGALFVTVKDGKNSRLLPVQQTFDGGWRAQDGPNDILAAVAPSDAAAVFAFGKQGEAPREGSEPPDSQPRPVVLADGSTAVTVQTLRSTGADRNVIGFRRADGSYLGYGGGISGVRYAGAEIVVSPRTQQIWNGNATSGTDLGVLSSSSIEDLPATGRTVACVIAGPASQASGDAATAPGCTAIIVPSTKVGTVKKLASGVVTKEMPIPSTRWKVIFGVRQAGETGKPLISYD